MSAYANIIGVGGFATVYNLNAFARKAFAVGREAACMREYEITQAISETMRKIEQRNAADKMLTATELASIRHGHQRLMLPFRLSKETTPIGALSLDFTLAECDLAHAAFTFRADGTRTVTQCPRFASPEAVLRVVTDCLSGLVFLHECARIVHNDIKPANILVCKSGCVRISDFGISHKWPADAPIYEHSETLAVSSVSYQAPEVWLNDMRGNGKADVFALGISLYEVFEGAKPMVLPPNVAIRFQEWQQCKDVDEPRFKAAFKQVMHEYHSDGQNYRNFARLVVGSNLKSYAYMHEMVPAAIRRMLRIDVRERPTARAVIELLRPSATTRTTADVATNTSPKLVIDTATQPTASRMEDLAIQAALDDDEPAAASLLNCVEGFSGLTQLAIDAQKDEAAAAGNGAVAAMDVQQDEAVASGNADVAPTAAAAATAGKQSNKSLGQTARRKYGVVDGSERDIAAATALIQLVQTQTKLNRSTSADRLLVKLERKARKDDTTSVHTHALKLFKRLQAVDRRQPLSYDERLVLGLLLQLPNNRTAGASNPHRVLFVTLTKRSTYWWKKNIKGDSTASDKS